jgi:hypothetical protein
MFHRRPLPSSGQPQPHRVVAPKAGVVVRARVLARVPELISVHWDPVAERNVPHLEDNCPGCLAQRPLAIKGMGYVASMIHTRRQLDSHVSEHQRYHDLVCLTLPETLVAQLCANPDVRDSWRGVEFDMWHATEEKRSRLLLKLLGKQDATDWPEAWDVTRDLEHMWADYLGAARLVSPFTEREPGEECA